MLTRIVRRSAMFAQATGVSYRRKQALLSICMALALTIAASGAANARPFVAGSSRATDLSRNATAASLWSGVWTCWDAGNPNPCHHTLWSTAFLSASNGWGVGDNGLIVGWDGVAWRSLPSPTVNNLRSIAMVSATNGWAVGDAIIIRWNGRTWASFANPAISFYAVAMVSA